MSVHQLILAPSSSDARLPPHVLHILQTSAITFYTAPRSLLANRLLNALVSIQAAQSGLLARPGTLSRCSLHRW